MGDYSRRPTNISRTVTLDGRAVQPGDISKMTDEQFQRLSDQNEIVAVQPGGHGTPELQFRMSTQNRAQKTVRGAAKSKLLDNMDGVGALRGRG